MDTYELYDQKMDELSAINDQLMEIEEKIKAIDTMHKSSSKEQLEKVRQYRKSFIQGATGLVETIAFILLSFIPGLSLGAKIFELLLAAGWLVYGGITFKKGLDIKREFLKNAKDIQYNEGEQIGEYFALEIIRQSLIEQKNDLNNELNHIRSQFNSKEPYKPYTSQYDVPKLNASTQFVTITLEPSDEKTDEKGA